MELEIGTILEHETCDSILMDLQGNTQDVNRHIEHWVVADITSKSYMLYNLDKNGTWRIPKEKMEIYLKGIKKYKIKPMFKISKEVG